MIFLLLCMKLFLTDHHYRKQVNKILQCLLDFFMYKDRVVTVVNVEQIDLD